MKRDAYIYRERGTDRARQTDRQTDREREHESKAATDGNADCQNYSMSDVFGP